MTVRDLIEYLEAYDDDAEVRLATQPEWPLAFQIASVMGADEISAESDYPDEEPTEAEEPIVWIASGSHPSDNPSAPGGAWA